MLEAVISIRGKRFFGLSKRSQARLFFMTFKDDPRLISK